jgi:2-succinyl-6-hydroxy-2,4-cyclohexadiene-1-carboxylate synthase
MRKTRAQGGLHAFIERWMAGPLFAAQRERGARFLQEAWDDRLSGSGRGFARSLRGMGQGAVEDLWSRLPAITQPVLLVAGERDQGYLAIMRRMAELLPQARLEVIPGAGHDVPSEQPELLRELLFAYLPEHESA